MTELPSRRPAAFLAELPAYPPPQAERLPDGMTLGNVNSGDLIAVDRRWLVIAGCTTVNGWVTIRFDSPGIEAITASETLPVHLARRASTHATP